jgi:RNA polymerase sigma-70 factor (ECF subfamily)
MTDDHHSHFIHLIDSARKGNQNSYAQLLTDIAPLLQGFIFNRLGAGADNEDILQEVLMAVHKALHTFNSDRSFKNWLFAIADYKIKDYLRVYYRTHANKKVDIEKIDSLPVNPVTNPASSSELAYELLEKLPETQKKILFMMKIQGYSVKQVAGFMNMSESAVKVSAHRAYNYLRNLSEENKKI